MRTTVRSVVTTIEFRTPSDTGPTGTTACQGRRNVPVASRTASPSTTSPSATRSARPESSDQPAAAASPSSSTGASRRAATSRPRPWRSDPTKRLWDTDTPAEPRAGSGSGRPASDHRHRRRKGQVPHSGAREVQTVAPRSSSACPKDHPAPMGTMTSTRAWASAGRTGLPATLRAMTRPAFVSTTPTSRSKAKARTARAVYGPTPGRANRSSSWSGTTPPCSATTTAAVAWRYLARRLYPIPSHARRTSPSGAAAHEAAVG